MGTRAKVSVGADTKANTLGGGGTPQRGHGAPLQPLAERSDARGSEFVVLIEAEVVAVQTVKVGLGER